MLGIEFMKASPTTYVLHYRDGRVKREGAGLSFWYYAPTSSIVAVPVGSTDVPFAFEQVTADFQTITLQGQLTYRIADAKRAAGLLDFSLKPEGGGYASDDPTKLRDRLVNACQVLAAASLGRMQLREALVSGQALVQTVLSGLKQAESVAMLGVEILGLAILSVKPTPDMSKALEAEAREALSRKQDEAIYARRNAAVEQERMIKESELNTEIAVEEKKRKIRETQMEADIAVEEQRAGLLDKRVANDKKETDSRRFALESALGPLQKMDWRLLMAATAGGGDPRLQMAVAFRELAENAQKIGQLNVTPDLLNALLTPR
ncbi:MAG TPA: SPFH domain-containing protein [Myxococcota bacterium]|jgi:regulator of protease activity HflC (stomatin/prohibitin superfamily)|nr:SPFH domain-containing protein [Myxococcota bacterium]